jgi:nuclear pore complex protein Nup160
LTRTEISVPVVRERSGSVSGSSGSPVSGKRGGGGGGGGGDETYSITALEGFIGHLLGFGSLRAEPLATTLTNMVSNLCATDSDVEVSPTLIQCTLVKRDRADLALELAPFCDQNPFSVYVQGRVFLALRDYNTAAIHFKKAAIGMSKFVVPSTAGQQLRLRC